MNKTEVQLDDLIGRPYKEDGRGPDYYDCWGLCMEVANRAGRKLPDLNVPADNDDRKELIDSQKRLNFRKLKKPKPWSLAEFRIFDDNGKEKWHIGIVLENCRQFIHITGKCSVCIVSLNHPFWSMFLEGFYEYKAD